MPYLTCDCGARTHILNAYMPAPGESEPVICSHCGKEWEVTATTHGTIEAEPVKKDDPGRLGRRRQREF